MSNDIERIRQVVDLYFKGTHQGDGAHLKRAFHPDVRITGIIKGQYCDWSLSEFITRVTASPTAESKGESYNKEILSVDNVHDAAMVKARVVVGGLIFSDYITLLKINGEWIIRNKSFTVEN
jgi:protease I